MSTRRILRSRQRAMSDPAAPSTPIPGPSDGPKLNEQGPESELFEPDSDELNEPSKNPIKPPRSSGTAC
ncbi:hypothetical protein GGU11DRAFT_751099 [Lentinula aff. detonsa]|nr:hypothetical protein GGU11DRAFT_751099 [Lentinula aff. detonsa]